uniref:Uncharacterized protein n=1 Tax=Siphoviridae sp. ctnFo11 TaxID=2826454 RepID=A0A8S5N5D6_9CAUD|nr:MAG TPA: hypothetical protein [Siphoviridae sp. ctnFo11]
MNESEALKLLKKANRDNDMVGILPKSDIGKCLIKALEEVQQYRQIGTVEECRAAVEKQTAKKPDYEGDGYSDGQLVYDTWICPCCGQHYEVDYDRHDYCLNCGQHIDWSDEE